MKNPPGLFLTGTILSKSNALLDLNSGEHHVSEIRTL
jgi:hypothetical protein